MYLFQRIVRAFVNDNINYPDQFRNAAVLAVPFKVGSDAQTLYGYNIINTNASTVYLKLYNSVLAPTVGTAIPVLTIPVPANGNVVFFGADQYVYFRLGFWIACVTGVLDTDTTAPGAGIIVQIQYK
jgi:hypothetical protein